MKCYADIYVDVVLGEKSISWIGKDQTWDLTKEKNPASIPSQVDSAWNLNDAELCVWVCSEMRKSLCSKGDRSRHLISTNFPMSCLNFRAVSKSGWKDRRWVLDQRASPRVIHWLGFLSWGVRVATGLRSCLLLGLFPDVGVAAPAATSVATFIVCFFF